MNHCVPDFEADEDHQQYSAHHTSSALRKKPAMAEEEIMELLWQNGQVVTQSQNQRSFKRFPNSIGIGSAAIPTDQHQQPNAAAAAATSHGEMTAPQHLFMQEDEMASWLHYPLDESSFDRDDFYSDFVYPPPQSLTTTAPTTTTTTPSPTSLLRSSTLSSEIRPTPTVMPIPPPSRPPPAPPVLPAGVDDSPKLQNFTLFSRLPMSRVTRHAGPSAPSKIPPRPEVRESTVVESNETPARGASYSRAAADESNYAPVSNTVTGRETMSGNAVPGISREPTATSVCELTVSSSPGGSGASASASAEPVANDDRLNGSTPPNKAVEDRKRKGRCDDDDRDCHSEDIEFGSADAKKQARGSTSTSTKRSRAAEVHNLSERRRRDRINERMRALQELIPRCNKADKASMLDEAIDYLKSLQMQVQMMTMGCSMVPMMYPGVQQFMPAMGMGMGMGMNRPVVPYPPLIPNSALANPAAAAAAHMAPRFPLPAFHMPPLPVPDPTRIQVSGRSDPTLNPLVASHPGRPRFPSFVDPYQQYIGIHQSQIPLAQNQGALQSGENKASGKKEVGNTENHHSG